MRLLIDANVLLDVLQNRTDFVRASALVWKLCETDQAEGFVSSLTFANLVYVMRKELTPETIEEVLKTLSLIFEMSDLTAGDLNRAARLHWNDYEDAVQSVTAERLHADYIVTRNVRDFRTGKVPAITPDELISRI